MGDPVLHLIAGPNGAGKTTFYRMVVEPVAPSRFINADLIAADLWPGTEVEHAYDAAAIAAAERELYLTQRRSFVTETVFSHPSKIALLQRASAAGFRTHLHVVLIPENLAVARVAQRVADGGHAVPESKIRGRFERLWGHLKVAIDLADETRVYDNSDPGRPFHLVATYVSGRRSLQGRWPAWAPAELREAGH